MNTDENLLARAHRSIRLLETRKKAVLKEHAERIKRLRNASDLIVADSLEPDSMLAFGLPQKLRPVRATHLLDENTPLPAAWPKAQLMHIPGHCPGSICLHLQFK